MAYDAGDELRRPVSLALAGVAIIGWLLAAFLWTEASRTQSEMTDSLNAAERAAGILRRGPAEPAKGGRYGRRPEDSGDRGGKGSVGSIRRARVGPERTRRAHKTGRRRQAGDLRRAGRGERQIARFAGGRCEAQGRERIVWPACRLRSRRCRPSRRGCRGKSTRLAPPFPKPRARPPRPRNNSTPFRIRSTRRPPNSTRCRARFVTRNPRPAPHAVTAD